MFSSFSNRLQAEISTIGLVLDAHDSLRALVYPVDVAVLPPGDDTHLEQIRSSGLLKPAWQTYDHCAAFTRLYAIYEQFVVDVATDYLRILPGIYPAFLDLPPSVRQQVRLGIGQILIKLGKDGPYKDLAELQVIEGWAKGILGQPAYSLLPDAFLIDPQNYRAATLAGLFRYLGFDDCWAWIEKHPAMIEYMKMERDANETPKTLLHDFVEYRNKASHTGIQEIVAVEEIKSIAKYVTILCETLAQLLMKRVVQRKLERGEAVKIGSVIHRFSNLVVGARMSAGGITVGDEVVAVQKNCCKAASVLSIRLGEAPHTSLNLADGQEIGLRLNERVNEGAELIRVSSLQPSLLTETLPEAVSPDDYPVDSIAPAVPAPEPNDGGEDG